MRIKRDFREISRQSIKKDFQGDMFRIAFVGENSGYFKHRRYLLGKTVRILKDCPTGGKYCEFVDERDRRALNAACGWTDKKVYLFDCVKFIKKV